MKRIALACTGLGHVRRGFESCTRDLFDLLKGAADITLFRGGGAPGAREQVIPNVPRQAALAWGLTRDAGRAYTWEQRTFALGLLPYLATGGFTVVHTMDGALANALRHLRRLVGLRFGLLFTNGGGHTPFAYAGADAIQAVTPAQEREALDYGIPRGRVWMIPLGVDADRFAAPLPDDRASLRARHGVPAAAWVVLAVSALNASDKRLDQVIREVAALGEGPFLLMSGQPGPETPALERLAAELLPGRHRFSRGVTPDVRELYRLADVCVLGSVREGFGLAAIEAAAAGVPVLVHDSEHFRWIVADDASLVDMTRAGAAAERLRMVREGGAHVAAMVAANRARVRARFAWPVLAPQYLQMYDAIGERA